MPKVKLPIYEGVSKATDEVGLKTHGADMVNVFVDELLNINRWPGYEEFADTGEAAKIDGLFWWENKSKVIAICNGKTFEITDSNGTTAEISGDTFETDTRAKFADFGEVLYGANGGKILIIGSVLQYDNQTGSFTPGNTLYGASSGAYALISGVLGSGTSGSLLLSNISGTFQDDEIIYEATYDSELLTDGDCSSDSFSVQTGWSYDAVNDEYDCDGSQTGWSSVYQTASFTVDCFYKVGHTVKNYSAGTTRGYIPTFGDGAYGSNRTADGTYTDILQATETDASGGCGVSGSADFIGSVDDVSVKKVTNAALCNGTLTSSYVNEMGDVDAPTEVTHVAVLDRYLIGNEAYTGNFHWADVNAPTTWTGNYSEAEANPDRLVALDVQNLNLWLQGRKVLEKWYDDGSTPFIRLYQGVIQTGTVAPYSFTWCNAIQAFCCLDENRRVVMISGGIAVPLSLSINKYIQDFTTVSDAIGDYVEIVGRPFYILTFPSEEIVLAYDFISKNWYRLASWNATSAEYDLYRGNCYCLAPAWNLTLMGDMANGKIYKLDPTIYDEDGSLLRSLVQTAHYNHGAESNRKFCNGIYVRLKRTSVVTEDDTPDLMIQYRDDGNTTWSTARSLTMHSSSNTEFLAYTTRLGSYYARQWRFYMTDAYPLCIVSVEEDVDIERD